jgi:RNA polymerase sigma factor (sigma-70 family)
MLNPDDPAVQESGRRPPKTAWYARRLAERRCPRCGAPAAPGIVHCEAHRATKEDARKQYKSYIAQGRCPRHPSRPCTPGRKRCAECQIERCAEEKARREERRGAGLCQICGKRPPDDGTARCLVCKQKRRCDAIVELAEADAGPADAEADGPPTERDPAPWWAEEVRRERYLTQGARGIEAANAANAALPPEVRSANVRRATEILNAGLTQEERRVNGRKGVAARLAKFTPEERSASSRKSAAERRKRLRLPKDAPAPAKLTYRDIAGDEEERLIRAYQAGDRRAGEVLLEVHKSLIWRYARKRCGGPRNEFDIEDLLQEGRIGFLKAVSKFEFDRGAKLATYASWWVQQAVYRFADEEEGAIAAPGNLKADVRRATQRGEEPETEAGRHLATLQLRAASMDEELGDDGGATRGEMMSGDGESPEDAAAREDGTAKARAAIEAALARVSATPRDLAIFRARFLMEEPPTLEALAQRYGRTRELIRQVEAKMLRKLRAALAHSPTEQRRAREIARE